MNFTKLDIENYCIEHSTPVSSTADALEKYTKESVHGSQMLIGKMEAAVLQFFIKLAKVKNILEIGTYTGYSALVMAEALPVDGKVTTIDVNLETTQIAKKFWAESKHGSKIESLVKDGLMALQELNHKTFDLIFIDADKNNYYNYLKWSLNHLSNNGMIITDNTLWSGRVLTHDFEAQTNSIREHNSLAKQVSGFQKVLLPIRDGMYLLTKN